MSYKSANIFKEISVLDNINLGRIINFAGNNNVNISSDINGNLLFSDLFNNTLSLTDIRAISTAQGTSKLSLTGSHFSITGDLDIITLNTKLTHFMIDASGYFGFGTNPSHPFHFYPPSQNTGIVLDGNNSDAVLTLNGYLGSNNISGRIRSGWDQTTTNNLDDSYIFIDTYTNRNNILNHDLVIKNNKVGINVKEPLYTLDIGGTIQLDTKIQFKNSQCRIINNNGRLQFFDNNSNTGVYIGELEHINTILTDNSYGKALTKLSYDDAEDIIQYDNCGNGVLFTDKIMLGNKDNSIRYDTTTNAFSLSNTNNPDFMYLRPEAFNLPHGPESQRPNVPAEGDMRLNTNINQLEAYISNTWLRLGGQALQIKDMDYDTFVSVDNDNTDDTDIIKMSSRGHLFLLADGNTSKIGINGIDTPEKDMDISGVVQIRDILQFTDTSQFKTTDDINFYDSSDNLMVQFGKGGHIFNRPVSFNNSIYIPDNSNNALNIADNSMNYIQFDTMEPRKISINAAVFYDNSGHTHNTNEEHLIKNADTRSFVYGTTTNDSLFGFNTTNNSIFSDVDNFGIGTKTADIGTLQVTSNNESLLCLESTKTFTIHDKINIQFGVREANVYYPRTMIESVFNGTTGNNNSGFDMRFHVGMGVNALGNNNAVSNGTNAFNIKSNGNIGIGIDNPQSNLDIRSDNGVKLSIIDNTSTDLAELALGQGPGNILTSVGLDNNGNKFRIKHIGIERFTIASNGKIGVNTNSPNNQFNVYGDTDLSGNVTILETTKCIGNIIGENNLDIENNTAIGNDVYITGNEQLNGNLDISGSFDLRGNMNVSGTNTIQLDGFVGINKSPNDYSLVVGSNTKTLTHTELATHKYFTNDSVSLDSLTTGNTNICAGFETGILSGGNIIATGASVFSDERIKTNFTNPENDWMDKVERLNPYEYELIDNRTGGRTLGYKAQDVRNILGNDFIKTTHNAIPNIFRNVEWVIIDTRLAIIKQDIQANVGDILKIQIVDNINKLYNENMEVLGVNESYIYIDNPNIQIKSFFIYGIYVNDFHTIEINKLNYLNTYCIRELIMENKKLKERLDKLASKLEI